MSTNVTKLALEYNYTLRWSYAYNGAVRLSESDDEETATAASEAIEKLVTQTASDDLIWKYALLQLAYVNGDSDGDDDE